MFHARLHDGTSIDVEVRGDGPTVLLPVNPRPVEGPQADAMRRWGADPALGRALVDGLADAFRVVAFDYEGHVLAAPKPDTLTPANVAGDILAGPTPRALSGSPTTGTRGSRSAVSSSRSAPTGSGRSPWAATHRSTGRTPRCCR
jgi:hypothetical protein